MSRRDRLRARPSRLPTAEVPLPADPAAHAAAEQRVALLEAFRAQLAVDVDVDGDQLQLAQQQLDDARQALAELDVEVFTFRCIEPARWEQLVDAHPPTDEQRRNGWQWNVPEFRPAVLAACYVPEPDGEVLDARAWVEIAEEGQMRPGELEQLFAAAVQLNARAPSPSLGKGSTPIRS